MASQQHDDTIFSTWPDEAALRLVKKDRRQLPIRPHSRVTSLAETGSPKSVPAGWKGKSYSKDTYAQYGASHGFDRSFQIGNGKGGNDGSDNNRDGREIGQPGQGGGNDRDNDPPKDEANTTRESAVAQEAEDFEGMSDDDLGIFGDTPRPTREAKSLFSHEYEDEMRTRLETSNWIQSEFLKSGDAGAKKNPLRKEQRRQQLWDRSYRTKKEKEHAKSTRQARPLQLPYDDGRMLGCWMWSPRSNLAKGPPSIQTYPFGNVYHKCWRTPIDQEIIWESDLLDIPAPLIYQSSFAWPWLRSQSLTKAYIKYDDNTPKNLTYGSAKKITNAWGVNNPDWFTGPDNTEEWLLKAVSVAPGWIYGPSAIDDPPLLQSYPQVTSDREIYINDRKIYINDPSGLWKFVEAEPDTVYVWAS